MTSQLEIRILRSIANESDAERKAIAKTKLACYLARTGEFKRSEDLRLEVRSLFGDGRSARVSILLMLLDGLLIYYRDLGPAARDRIARANLISLATRMTDLVSITFAWLAHIDFNKGDYVAMVREIRQCLDGIQDDLDDIAITRVSLVLGDAFLHCGKIEASRVWYERARLAATKQGDQAAIGAITYNRAALHVQNLRLRAVTGQLNDSEVRFASGELQSAVSYQRLATLRSLDHLLTAASIGIRMIEKSYAAAQDLILELKKSGEVKAHSAADYVLRSDHALCSVKTGDPDLAISIASEILEAQLEGLEADDRVIVYSNLCAVFESEAGSARHEEATRRMLSSINEYLDKTRGLAEMLFEFENV